VCVCSIGSSVLSNRSVNSTETRARLDTCAPRSSYVSSGKQRRKHCAPKCCTSMLPSDVCLARPGIVLCQVFHLRSPASKAAVAWTLPPITPPSVIETVLGGPLDTDVPTYHIFPIIAKDYASANLFTGVGWVLHTC
jgi:hypothetical protein